MLDENLPAFFLKPSASGIKHHRDIYLSHRGSDPAPAYTLHNADPASPAPIQKNAYGAALFDAFNPEILYAEVLMLPSWTTPTISAEELRRHDGITPPPQPILPNEFSIQLYNPDMQVRVEIKEGKWGGSERYEFSMPQTSFRTPSASNLDRGQSDPASLAITPKVNFVWRRESKLSKELTCFMTGKSTDTIEKKKSKRDPDIAIALWRSMRELTIYEPNMERMDMEDPKGLEVVLLLSAIVIKDVYFAHKDQMHELFNISGTPADRKLSGSGRRLTNTQPPTAVIGQQKQASNFPQNRNDEKRSSLPRLQTTPPQQMPLRPPRTTRPPPLADPRKQWELDAETARLKAQAEAEAKAAQDRQRQREKADEAERKRLQRMVEEEEKEARRKRAEIDKETERLRRQYGVPPSNGRPTSNVGPYLKPTPQHVQFAAGRPGRGQPSASSSALMMSGANPGASSSSNVSKPAKKKSFFGLRSLSDDAEERRKVVKKSSSMW
ncbi:uncharacterized protein RCC_10274 [Ramularia collo-cygni]|uniref:Uncharacterized protein n=1 Tax=Ramularia collo-cygni TaxID=112498 RepID=A0A2D3VLN7_9PEZI|nr:uncharacterized protein RCC_10274 [Ramularia collo-cygni]CZT24549.1 uncharacterized protein RCC_10274 [Ramularia collo-cygni]